MKDELGLKPNGFNVKIKIATVLKAPVLKAPVLKNDNIDQTANIEQRIGQNFNPPFDASGSSLGFSSIKPYMKAQE